MHTRRRIALGLVVLACGAGPARGDGWVQAFSELRPAPLDLGDARVPLAERAAFARTLGAFGPSAEVVPVLLSALREPSPPPLLRDEILVALARRAPAQAAVPLAVLLAELREPPPELAMALAAIGTDEAISALIAALVRPEAAAVAERGLLRAGVRAAPALARALSGPSAVRAACVLGELGPGAWPHAATALERALDAPSRALRAAAARALGRMRVARAAPALLSVARDPAPDVALAALDALAELAGPAQAPELERRLASAKAERRPKILRALARAEPRRAVPHLARVLEGDDAALREAALAVLEGEQPDASFVPLLARRFEREPRESTASALSRVEGGEGVPALLRAGRRSPGAAAAAARALAIAVRRFGDELDGDAHEQALSALRALDDAPRRLLLRGLARDGDVRDELVAALSAQDPELRAAAASAAHWLGDAEVAPALLSALEREADAEAARRLARAALALGARAPLRPLQRLLADPETAPEAMQLAAASGDRGALGRELPVQLRRALASRQPSRVRAAAALALGALGDPAAFVPLRAALADPSARVRLAAVRALGALGDPRAAEACEVHARVERDALVRRAAQRVAEHHGSPLPLAARGPLVLEARVAPGGTAEPALLDVLLDDGRWLRVRVPAGGELIVADLPPGTAEVRRVD